MTNYTLAEVRAAGQNEALYVLGGASEVLRKSRGLLGPFDIFLSHSFHDAELILGVRTILQRAGKRVYVDWIDDPELDRAHVTKSTANRLRQRMQQCTSMVYAATKAATTSRWMPWELGYFDGRKGPEAVAIMPLVSYQGENVGQEYLGLYPTVERSGMYLHTPVVTRREAGTTRTKSLDDLVAARGGAAWRAS
ncbi:toll-Interleukin receptor [Rathayibacter sp. VKM Ac-2760]|uniref:toll-Interleukin receptor n=1 Tax=Rathayibacter sp. VKM Ac-2760 TaxID=2609253 RepID=UPI0013168DD9|nr:toll-Interleukin receptor [Rathayibacter sp. VKM Ac-2760]QHC61223.1 toll-Interleukin receptor [Rathayibacter sp. VKM Ac-2760]